MDAYLKGYYGYRNYGDELLFFGVIRQLFTRYPLTKLYVEVGDKGWMEDWIRENYQGLLTEKQLSAITCVPAKQHSCKLITHLVNILGIGRYRKLFKFFGGGEVLSDERMFPHDGRNIPLLFHHTITQGKFALLGGIGKIRNKRTERLYAYLLPKAERIIVRDRDSYEIAKRYNPENTLLYQDFAQEIILSYEGGMTSDSKIDTPYVLVNINKQSMDADNIQKIKEFIHHYHGHKKIFFPCDMNDDHHCFQELKKHISGLEYYDRTKHPLSDSLSLFFHADGGIGARLHFLLPLKLYEKPMVAIPYADKINKLIIKR